MKKFTLLKLLVLSIFIGTICFTSCSNPASSGNSGSSTSSEQPSNPKTTVPPNPGTTDPANPGTTDPANPGTTDPANPGTTDPANPGTTDPSNPGTTDPSNPGTTDPVTPQEPEYTITTNCTGCTIALSAEKAKAGTSITYTITCQVQYILKDNSAVSIKDAAGNSISTNGSSFVMPESDVTISVTAVKLPDDYGKAKNITYAFAGTTLACQWDYDGPEDFISKYIVKDTSRGVTFPVNSNYLIVKNFETSQERTLTIYVENVLGDLIKISDAFKIQKNEVSISDIEAYYTKYNDFFTADENGRFTKALYNLNRDNTPGPLSSIRSKASMLGSEGNRNNSNDGRNVYYLTNQLQDYAGKMEKSQKNISTELGELNKKKASINTGLEGIAKSIEAIKSLNNEIDSFDIQSREDIATLYNKISSRDLIIQSIPDQQNTIKEIQDTIPEVFDTMRKEAANYYSNGQNASELAGRVYTAAEKIGSAALANSLKMEVQSSAGIASRVNGEVFNLISNYNTYWK